MLAWRQRCPKSGQPWVSLRLCSEGDAHANQADNLISLRLLPPDLQAHRGACHCSVMWCCDSVPLSWPPSPPALAPCPPCLRPSPRTTPLSGHGSGRRPPSPDCPRMRKKVNCYDLCSASRSEYVDHLTIPVYIDRLVLSIVLNSDASPATFSIPAVSNSQVGVPSCR